MGMIFGILRSVSPPHWQWPAPMGSWRVCNWPLSRAIPNLPKSFKRACKRRLSAGIYMTSHCLFGLFWFSTTFKKSFPVSTNIFKFSDFPWLENGFFRFPSEFPFPVFHRLFLLFPVFRHFFRAFPPFRDISYTPSFNRALMPVPPEDTEKMICWRDSPVIWVNTVEERRIHNSTSVIFVWSLFLSSLDLFYSPHRSRYY